MESLRQNLIKNCPRETYLTNFRLSIMLRAMSKDLMILPKKLFFLRRFHWISTKLSIRFDKILQIYCHRLVFRKFL